MMKLLLVFAAAVPLFAQGPTPCTYQPSASGFTSAASASDPKNLPSFTVSTQTNCAFIVGTAAPWLHVVAPPNGEYFAGPSTIAFSIDQNTGSQLRKDSILLYSGTQVNPGAAPFAAVSVTQLAGVCTFTLAPTADSVPVAGGSGSITVTTGCQWAVGGASSFIKTATPSGTLGTGLITYTVASNPCVAPRTGAIVLQTGAANPPSFTVTQAGAITNLSLSSSAQTFDSGAQTNQKLTVTTGTGCPWTTYTDASTWIHNSPTVAGLSTASGNGNGTYIYAVDANSGAARTGHVFFQSGVDAQGAPILAAALTITQQAFQAPGPQISAILNAASYAVPSSGPAPISPGEIVALFGTSLGPILPVSNTSSFGTSLAGVQVFFGSTAAPLIFVSAQQINAVVPYGLPTGGNAAVTVRYNGGASPAFTAPVQAATPGIFSQDKTGTGPGAILNNVNFQLNSPATPAAIGSVVAIFCTGAGVTTPASIDGALSPAAPPFPTLDSQPVSVTIGGLTADIFYAGPAPGLIAGLTQIDAVVPNGVKPGSLVPVVVSVGGVPSQGNLSMTVK
jgi:uncharacterized protein (TIGR03437 family)